VTIPQCEGGRTRVDALHDVQVQLRQQAKQVQAKQVQALSHAV